MTFLFNNMNMFGMNGLCSGFGNPFSFGGFGGGCGFSSIFNMLGGGFSSSFGGCFTPSITGSGYDNWGSVYNINGNFGPSGKAVAGWAIGTSIFGAAAMWADNAISERQARKAQEAAEYVSTEELQEQIDSLETENSKLFDNKILKENKVTQDNIGTFDITDDTPAQLSFNKAEQALTGNQKTINAFTREMEALLNTYPTINDAPEDKKEEWNKAQIAKVDADRAKEAQPGLEKAKNDAEKELNALKDAIQNAKDKLKENNDKIESLKEQLESQVLDAADGSKYGLFKNGRTSQAKLDAKIKQNDYSDCTVRDMHAAISAYSSANTDKDKQKYYKEAFIKMFDAKYPNRNDAPTSLREAYKMFKKEDKKSQEL